MKHLWMLFILLLLPAWAAAQAQVLNGAKAASMFVGADACAKIQAAHDALPSTGGTVIADFVGSQTCSTSMTFTKPVHLVGLGKNNTVLSYSQTSGNFVTFALSSRGLYDRRKHITISDVTLSGPGSGTGTGIAVTDGPGWTIERVVVSGFRDGIVANGSSGGGTLTNLGVLQNVESRGNLRYGVQLTGNGTELILCLASDASENQIGWQIESGLHQFQACSAYLNTSKDMVFSGSSASLNRGFIYLEQSGSDGKIHFETNANNNEIYAIGGSFNEAHAIDNAAGADGSGREFNATLRREPYFKDPTGSARAAHFAANVFATTGANAGTHIGVTGLGQVVASNDENLTGSVVGVRGTVTGVTGSTGTLSNGMGLQSTASYNGGPVTTHYGLRIEAPSGSVTPGIKYGVYAATGSGRSSFVDGVDIGTSVAPNGSGLKHARLAVTDCATTGCSVTWTFATAFTDANFTPACTILETSAQAEDTGLRLAKIRAQSGTGLTVDIDNLSGILLSGTVNCMAIHD